MYQVNKLWRPIIYMGVSFLAGLQLAQRDPDQTTEVAVIPVEAPKPSKFKIPCSLEQERKLVQRVGGSVWRKDQVRWLLEDDGMISVGEYEEFVERMDIADRASDKFQELGLNQY